MSTELVLEGYRIQGRDRRQMVDGMSDTLVVKVLYRTGDKTFFVSFVLVRVDKSGRMMNLKGKMCSFRCWLCSSPTTSVGSGLLCERG